MATISIGSQDRLRTSILTDTNVFRESNLGDYITNINDSGVIEGFNISSNSIGKGSAWLSTTNTNTDKRYVYVRNYEDISFEGTDGYIYINIQQSKIDSPYLNNERGTGIATIEVSSQGFPSSNYIPLAIITSGSIEDNRHIVDTQGENGDFGIDDYSTSINNLNKEIQKNSSVSHFEGTAYVGEKYTINDKLFKQETPKLSNATIDANVGDVDANKEIHIQRIGSGTASNKLKLKMKMGGTPTTSVVVEVRKGIQVDVSDIEAYWYGDENNIIATGSLTSSSFTNAYAEVEFTLNNNFGGTEGELLDIVVYQSSGSGATVDSTNYYIIGCDSTQWSEAFSYVKVNGQTCVREKLMPYCISDGFIQSLLCKDKNDKYYVKGDKLAEFTYNGNNTQFSPSVNMNGVLIEMDLDFDASNPWIGAWLQYSSGYAISDYAQASKSGLFYMKFTQNYTCYTLSLYKSATYGTTSNPISLLSNTIRIFKYIGEVNGKILEQVYVREVKDIGKKAAITTFGTHIDNTRILDENAFTNSDKIKYCKTKGTNHSNSKMLTSYTAIGFGYFTFSGVGSSSAAASVEINGDWVAYSSYSTAYISGIEFFKPGDVINFSGLTYLGLHDYY